MMNEIDVKVKEYDDALIWELTERITVTLTTSLSSLYLGLRATCGCRLEHHEEVIWGLLYLRSRDGKRPEIVV